MDADCLTSRAELEALVGGQPLGSMLKSITAFDQHCDDLLAVARVAIMGWTDADGQRRSDVVGGAAGFASASSPTSLGLDLSVEVDGPVGTGVGLLFLVPGLGETLRVNGRLRSGASGIDRSGIDVDEIFVHCAKAVIRSHLWNGGLDHAGEVAGPTDVSDSLENPSVREFLGRSPFVVLTTADQHGAADASPKGDPAGFLCVIDDHTIALPDRPGNHRTDTFHNLVEDAAIGLLALVPGDSRVLELSGRARLTTDEQIREPMAVNDRIPKVAVLVDIERVSLRDSSALVQADLWNPTGNIDPKTLPKMTQVWADHVKANEQTGEDADFIRQVVTADALDDGIAHDYATNLY